MSTTLHIQSILKERRKEAGKMHPPSRVRAEAKLLFNDVFRLLSTTIDQTADDEFPLRYRGIINLPDNVAPHNSSLQVLEALTYGNSVILGQPGKKDDVLWKEGQQLGASCINFWPFCIDPSKLIVPPHQRRYRKTREDVLFWDRVAVMISDSNVPALVRLLRKDKRDVVAILAADKGVCVIFRVGARDYPTWQHCCRVLDKQLSAVGVHAEKISLRTLVPISNGSRGRGALLYLP